MGTCPTCGSNESRQDPLRPTGIRICGACNQTFQVVQVEEQ